MPFFMKAFVRWLLKQFPIINSQVMQIALKYLTLTSNNIGLAIDSKNRFVGATI